MGVSKRLRFEILRRDEHACKYCGRSAPEVVLTVDHVVPVALGGGDDPANLVAACKDCNAGKSSVPADAPLVADVSADALRWAAAMAEVAERRAAECRDNQGLVDWFDGEWCNWTNWKDEPFDIPSGPSAILPFFQAGLTKEEIRELIGVAMRSQATDKWRYFCGCCWRRVTENQELAARIVAAPPIPAIDDTLVTRVTRSQIKTSLCWLSDRLIREFGVSEDEALDLDGHSCIHEDNLSDCRDLVCAYIALAEWFMGMHAAEAING